MTETAKERIYREAFEEIKKVCDTQDHVDNDLLRFFITKKMMEIENLPVITDNLSVEKLQEQLNTAKEALTEIVEKIEEHNQIYDFDVETTFLLETIDVIAQDALAAIGGDDEQSN